MLTQEPQIRQQYVETGQVKLIFWPVLNHGNPSVFSTLTMHCIGQQNAFLAWTAHNVMFERQSELWRAERDYYVALAGEIGVDTATFEACYDSPEALQTIQNLDRIRSERGVRGQPFFTVNDGPLIGSAALLDAIAAALP